MIETPSLEDPTGPLQFPGEEYHGVPTPVRTLLLQHPTNGIITRICHDFSLAIRGGQIQINSLLQSLFNGIEATYHGLSPLYTGFGCS